jgi:hypothetical protein
MCYFSSTSYGMDNLIFTLLTCSISPNIREGLLEVFYGVYEKDPDKVCFSGHNSL